MTDSSYNENMAKPIKHKSVSPKTVDLDALTRGADSIAYHAPALAQINLYANDELSTGSGHESVPGDLAGIGKGEGEEGQGRETGGRSESFTPPAKVTAKPLSPNSQPLLSNPLSTSPSNMPVLGVPMGVHQKEGGKVVQTYHEGGIHSKTSPVLGHNESSVEITSIEVPYSPDVEAPNSTEEVVVTSPFITHNDRIDRRTAFSKYCQLGEGRTYMKVANIMGVPLDTIKDWAREDLWENAYRERITADVIQEAREENIHEALDMKREMIALLKAKLVAAKNGESVFKSPKEMLDVLRQVEELTGSANLQGRVQPNQIYVVISPEEYEARMKSNEQLRKEEAKA
jgi:hypothetical protein